MMLFALLCHVDPAREADRRRLRAEHLAYVVAHRPMILFGGPTLSAEGAPETMILVVEATDLEAAHSFIAQEPYTRHGVFDRVDVRAWARVLPEAHPGALEAALAEERAHPPDASGRQSQGLTP